jgi:DUF4097 and DUF4098 domain-containing protein YvlB
VKTIVVIIIAVITVACLIAAGVIALATDFFTNGFNLNNLNNINEEVKKMNVNMTKTLDLSGVDKVKVYMQTGSVTVRPADKAEAVLTGYVIGSADRLQFDVQKNGSEASVTIRQVTGVFNFTIGEISLDLTLPAGYNGELEVHSATAKVTIGDFSLKALNTRLTTGTLQAEALAQEVNLESTTGTIALNGKDRKYTNIRIRSTTGSIEAKALLAASVDCKSTTGRISLANITADKIVTEATTGRIVIADCTGAVDARAMTGTIDARMNSVQAGYFETTTGKVTLSLPKEAAFNLDARTTTGGINTKFKFYGEMTGEKKFSAGAEIKGQANGGGPEVKIHTTTGGVEIIAR